MRLEYQIIVLLLISVGALSFDYFVPRTETVAFETDEWELLNSNNGKGTRASTAATERGAETRFKISDEGDNPFVATVFTRGAKSPIDLSWFTKVRLKAYVVGRDEEFFRMFVRTRIPELYKPSVSDSRQYNEITFKLTNEPQTIEVDRERFYVPNWWIEKNATDPGHSISSFDIVDSIEICTGSSVREASMKLVVEEIELTGKWIPPIVLYRSLLASWLLLALGVIVRTYTQYRKAIVQSEERASRLKMINSSLTSQATQLERMAHYDAVTGLLNRYGLRNDPRVTTGNLEQVGTSGLIAFDIDHFKMVNDTQGHNFGDQILADIGTLLAETAKGNELVTRWGGEEFVVVCIGVCESDACDIAESFRQLIESTVGVTCSFGVSEINADELFIDALDRADRAMYEAKSKGRNRVVSYRDLQQVEKCSDTSTRTN